MNDMTYSVDIEFDRGDKRITYTKEYIITEIVEGINGYKQPVWKIESIEKNKKSDNKDKNILHTND